MPTPLQILTDMARYDGRPSCLLCSHWRREGKVCRCRIKRRNKEFACLPVTEGVLLRRLKQAKNCESYESEVE